MNKIPLKLTFDSEAWDSLIAMLRLITDYNVRISVRGSGSVDVRLGKVTRNAVATVWNLNDDGHRTGEPFEIDLNNVDEITVL